jgi:H+/Cl- antiporter ClcA
MHVATARWQRRALFVLGGVVVGATAVALAAAADQAAFLSRVLLRLDPRLAWVITPAGFAACSFLSRRYFPNSGGSGIPQAIAARALRLPEERGALVSLRMAAGKTALVLLGLVCGASIGREGPTVQIGASIMNAAGRLSPRRQPGLILAGAAAGVAAAFNTPLAGIVFGIEEMSRSFEVRTSGVIIGGVIAAGITSLALQGDYTYFGTTHETLRGFEGWLAVPLLGVCGGLAGGVFSRVLIWFGNHAPRVVRAHPVVFAGLCGVAVAACGTASGGVVFGTGYNEARALVQGTLPAGQGGLPAAGVWFGAWKFLATLLSSISFIPGGIFAPSLAVGAGLGADAALLLPGAPAQALIVLGMVAYFAGVVQAPITAFVIVAEMTNDHAMVVPLMLAALIAYGTSRLVCPEGVYHALARGFLRSSFT